jgi:hypothetical protein
VVNPGTIHAHYDLVGLPAFLMQIFLVGIVLGYLLIAWQFWQAATWSKRPSIKAVAADDGLITSRARTAFFQLLLIFVFCSCSGYLPRLISFPLQLFFWMHAALFAATWWFVLSRQAVVIAEAMSRHAIP